MNKALFLDRDGVVNEDYGYVFEPERIRLRRNLVKTLMFFQALNYAIVIITNQSGIARNYFNLKQYRIVENYIHGRLKMRGIHPVSTYFCPHHPLGSNSKYRISCDCRKPKSGLFFAAARDLNISLSRSIMIGDKISDVEASYNAGIRNNYLLEKKSQGNSSKTYKTIKSFTQLLSEYDAA